MNRLGIESLNAGAPDIRLTGDQRPTYTQRRRNQMAYGGTPGADGRRAYGIGSVFQSAKDKFVDDIIPNEIKENPMLTAALVGGGINQFGLPDFLTESMNMGSDVGQNWIGDLLGAAIPGGTQFNTVLGDKVPFTYGMPDYSNVTGVINPMNIGTNIGGITGITSSTEQDALNYAKQYGLNLLGEKLGLTPQQQQQQQQQQRQDISWKIPMAIGAGAGAYQKKYLEDQPPFPGDETSINFQTGAEAMADPTQRFKPKAQYADLAEGGRIGYEEAGAVDPEYNGWKRIYEQNPGVAEMHDNHQQYLERYESEGQAQGGRIGAQEGGLMDLGGMEKDYRQEGGFVPIGGREKADDVPARLSKNEFVFTADAVRAAGGGDIDAGAEVMENVMKNLEAGGEVSEESQGLVGARSMFANAQQLEKRII